VRPVEKEHYVKLSRIDGSQPGNETLDALTFPLSEFVNAELLARPAADRRENLLNSPQEFAWSRELLGVHYPSDSEAGRIWAADLVQFLFENKQFVRDFETVKKESEQTRPK
jgi:hypothetical protein